ncbi:MAG: transcriptional regulator [Sphaerochaetaceae bacterium]
MGIEVFSQANEDFEKAKRRGRMQALLSSLTWKNSNLLSFYAVTKLIKPKNETYRGMQTIPVKDIIGSEGRYHDFSLAFYPKKEMLRSRWRSIDTANRENVILPPISVYKVGGNYFVRDGNHRVSVAKTQGVEFIDAEVVELDSEIKLEPGMTMKQLNQRVCEYERERFINQYHPNYLPMDRIVFSSPGLYPELVQHILVHKYYINQDKTEEISFDIAAKSWFANVFEPIVAEIRHDKILASFPGKTEADLYMWVVRHWDNLKSQKGQGVTIQNATRDYQRRFGKDLLTRTIKRIRTFFSRNGVEEEDPDTPDA